MGLIIDNFAGGGGASTGLEAALGRPVDIAINHDEEAVAMHRVNHPATEHLCQSVWKADPVEVCKGRPVDVAWFSPDCKHFSKAKGGKPVENNIRDLAWVVVMWAQRVRPKVILLENVEEFRTWGPLTEDGRPCPQRQGETFEIWQAALRKEGYRVEFRELRACDFGGKVLNAAATIRKRLFMIARCDGLPIVWPAPTHGAPTDPEVIAGRKKPWRVAANIIDFSLPCPSIFDTSEEIMRRYGLRSVRPLAEATLRRVARGVMRYVINNPQPFIVGVGGRMGQTQERGFDQPLQTLTAKGDASIVMPFVAPNMTNNAPQPVDRPVPTITTGGRNILAAVHVSRQFGKSVGGAADEPVGTITARGAGKAAVVAAFLAQHNTGVTGHSAEEPVSTLTAKPGPQGVVSTHLMMMRNSQKPWTGCDEPMHTITAGGAWPHMVATHLQTLRGSNRRDQATDDPLRTVSAGGNHSALISAFLTKYYGTAQHGSAVDDPLHTATTKDRHGLVTVQIDGQTYAITDIGMRMLTPRERFRAQGFPDSYIIDHGLDADGRRIDLSLDAQGRMCGNSVCPPLAEALVRANVAVEQRAEAA